MIFNSKDKGQGHIYIFFNVNVAVIETLLYADERKCSPISTSGKLNVHSALYNLKGPLFDIHGDC